MSNRKPGMFARMRSLFGGLFGSWVRDKEQQAPEVVYEQAIAERVRQYRELKDAVAGILYMRNKLESEIADRRAEIARLHDDVRRAIRRGEDESSLALIAHKQALFEDLERAEQELRQVRVQAEEAKNNLGRFREEIRSLVREKGRMLATLANAQARRRMQEAIDGLSVDAEMKALEGVREHIARISTEGALDREIGGDDMRARLAEIRDEMRDESARRELEEIKQQLRPRVLPQSAPRAEEGLDLATGQVVPVATG
jgi:phage shock protein A